MTGVTAFVTLEANGYPASAPSTAEGRFSNMSESIFALNVAGGRRSLQVIKARGTAHDLHLHEVTIDAKGVHVQPQASR